MHGTAGRPRRCIPRAFSSLPHTAGQPRHGQMLRVTARFRLPGIDAGDGNGWPVITIYAQRRCRICPAAFALCGAIQRPIILSSFILYAHISTVVDNSQISSCHQCINIYMPSGFLSITSGIFCMASTCAVAMNLIFHLNTALVTLLSYSPGTVVE